MFPSYIVPLLFYPSSPSGMGKPRRYTPEEIAKVGDTVQNINETMVRDWTGFVRRYKPTLTGGK
jgi:hypothetical protein